MVATHNIESVTFDQNFIRLQVDGRAIKIPIEKASKKIALADEIQRNLFTISPSGYGIHWPLLDEDLSIDSLLKSAL